MMNDVPSPVLLWRPAACTFFPGKRGPIDDDGAAEEIGAAAGTIVLRERSASPKSDGDARVRPRVAESSKAGLSMDACRLDPAGTDAALPPI
jgi:hypothetical protein